MSYTETLETMTPFFDPNAEYVLFGVGRNYHLYKTCLQGKLRVRFCVDNDCRKQGTSIDGLEIKNPDVLDGIGKTVKIIIVTGSYCSVRDQLLRMGFRENMDFCYIRRLIPPLYWLRESKLYLTEVSFLVTLRCTLRCQHCSILVPYGREVRHRSFESLRDDVDLLFRHVDRVYNFKIMGGEPTASPSIGEFIDHFGRNHRHKIDRVRLVTNATVPLAKNTLAMLKEYAVEVEIGDYSAFTNYKYGIEGYIRVLEDNKISYVNYRTTKNDTWVDFGDLRFPKGLSPSQTRELYHGCAYYSRGLYEKKLYYCAINCGMVAVHLIKDNENDCVRLDLNDATIKERLFALETGDLKLGCTTLCANCNGDYDVNRKVIPAGEQLPRTLLR